MHILFLTDNFPPEVNAPASRTFEHWAKLDQPHGDFDLMLQIVCACRPHGIHAGLK